MYFYKNDFTHTHTNMLAYSYNRTHLSTATQHNTNILLKLMSAPRSWIQAKAWTHIIERICPHITFFFFLSYRQIQSQTHWQYWWKKNWADFSRTVYNLYLFFSIFHFCVAVDVAVAVGGVVIFRRIYWHSVWL